MTNGRPRCCRGSIVVARLCALTIHTTLCVLVLHNFVATAASDVLRVPHDYVMCVRWGVDGGGLPASDVMRCFTPFEQGGADEISAALLSPGRHIITVTMVPPERLAASLAARRPHNATAPREAVTVSTGTFEAAFDASAGVAHPVVIDAADAETCPVLDVVDANFWSVTAVRDCAAAARGVEACAAIAREVDFLHASMEVAYGAARSEALEALAVGDVTIGEQERLLELSGVPRAALVAPPPSADFGFYAARLEPHAAVAGRMCARLFANYGVQDEARGPPLATCIELLRDGVSRARSGGEWRLQFQRPNARFASGALYPRVNGIAYWDEVDAMESYLHHVGAVVSMSGTAHTVTSIARNLAALDNMAPRARTVCEIGLNGGHSALLWLLGAPAARVVAFDIGFHEAQAAARWLSRRFPGRFTLVTGASQTTVPEYARAHPSFECDFWFVDGDHTYDGARVDMENARASAAPRCPIVLDDVTNVDVFGAPLRVWREFLRDGRVVSAGPRDSIGGDAPAAGIPGTAVGFAEAIGRFVR